MATRCQSVTNLMIELKHKQTGEVMYRINADTLDGVDLRGANLHNVSFVGMRMRGANLHGANLTGADLQDADLAGANLSSAKLDNALLDRSDLSRAMLIGASLGSASLQNATLAGANLMLADMQWSNFSGALFGNATIADANLSCADFRGADLTDVLGFDTATLGEAVWDESTQWPPDGCEPQAPAPLTVRILNAWRDVERSYQYSLWAVMVAMAGFAVLFAVARDDTSRSVAFSLMFASLPCGAIPILVVLYLFIHHRIRSKLYSAEELDSKPDDTPEDGDRHDERK